MAKKLLVRTPLTKDGLTLVYDDQKQVVYKESIVELTAKKQLESLNAAKPTHLRAEIKEVEVTDATPQGDSNEALKKKLAELEAQKENEELKQRIADLEAQLAGNPNQAVVTPDPIVATPAPEVTSEEKPKGSKK